MSNGTRLRASSAPTERVRRRYTSELLPGRSSKVALLCPQTSKGTLFVTSLANFRSDYTIVHIPNGNFLDIREQLYTNINLLRMGCSGRSALTLEEPRSVSS